MAAETSLATTVEKSPPQPAGEAGTVRADPKSASSEEGRDDALWKPVLGLPCELNVDLPLPGFRVADFLRLRTGSVINAHWRLGRDVPLRLNGMLMGWSEFEIVGDKLAVRLTELA